MAAKGFSLLAKVMSVGSCLPLLSLILSTLNLVQVSGLLCYSCSHVAHQRDCTRIVQCGSHEKCFGRRFLTPDGLTYFSSGCESVAGCSARRSFNIPHDSQHKMTRLGSGDIQACDQCCDDKDYCNVQLCDIPIQIKERCLFCDDVINPEDCNLSLQCDEDQYCYTEHIYVNREKRFRMGCAHRTGCKVGITSTPSPGQVAPVVGRRETGVSYLNRYKEALPVGDYCAKCCTGTNCNRDLCTSRQVVNQYELTAPPSLVLCQDYETSSCRDSLTKDPTFCDDPANKRLFCPRTCNTCSGGGLPLPVVTTTQQSVTNPVTSMTTTPLANCTDGMNCAQYADFFCSPSNPSGIDVCPITCKNPRCVASASTTTAAPLDCSDPIPRCQCEYLEKNLQICQDGDPELQKFCCFYCREVNNPGWSCNDTDKLFCDSKENDFSNQIQGLNITCHAN
eukprot:XP_011429402.1 PREDICTED: uncharacterized protein LOC105329740 isoform X1 [Crassostrea gigas]